MTQVQIALGSLTLRKRSWQPWTWAAWAGIPDHGFRHSEHGLEVGSRYGPGRLWTPHPVGRAVARGEQYRAWKVHGPEQGALLPVSKRILLGITLTNMVAMGHMWLCTFKLIKIKLHLNSIPQLL